MNKDTDRITTRFSPHEKLKLDELSKALNTSYSNLIRTMVNDFIKNHEDHLNNIIDKYNNANN